MAEWSLMHPGLLAFTDVIFAWAETLWTLAKVIVGFSFIIFVHELGHFLAAKWVGIRVDRFSVGFGPRLFGWRGGEGLTFGARPNYTADELVEKRYSETDYCFRALPLGGYVKMLGEDDILIDEKTGEMKLGNDPRAFPSRPVGQRLIVASAGVTFNLLFAALLLMCVFLVGRPVITPVIGMLEPDSPAMRAGLQRGDRIVSIDGNSTESYNELRIAEILADKELRLRVKRADKVLDQDFIVPLDGNDKLRSIGIMPAETNIVAAKLPFGTKGRMPDEKDEITQVNGREVRDGAEIHREFSLSDGHPVKLTVKPADGGPSFQCDVKPVIAIAPDSMPPDTTSDEAVSYRNILGLIPRRVVMMVNKGTPAERGGLLTGDVIMACGPVANPRYEEIVDLIQQFASKKLRVTVERNGESLDLEIVPKRAFQLFGKADAKIGALMAHADPGIPVVADTMPETPAAAMKLPRGALLVALDDHPVGDWFDVIRGLSDAAGRTVSVRYRVGDQEAVSSMAIPSSIVNELGLPRTASVLSINDQKSIRREKAGEDRLPSPEAVRRILATRIGESVSVRYQVDPFTNEIRTAQFNVTKDNVDPWQMRIEFGAPLALRPQTEPVSAGGNPFKAMYMGAEMTYDVVVNVLYTMKQSTTKRGAAVTENMSGPVGIVSAAMDVARTSFTDLLFFMAFLSANLAVFNLLPIPVMDGGLIMFLLIEKVKGKPLSLKTQMISTIVGLAVILLMVVVVTIQDVAKLL